LTAQNKWEVLFEVIVAMKLLFYKNTAEVVEEIFLLVPGIAPGQFLYIVPIDKKRKGSDRCGPWSLTLREECG
jgi:hypothetical protein